MGKARKPFSMNLRHGDQKIRWWLGSSPSPMNPKVCTDSNVLQSTSSPRPSPPSAMEERETSRASLLKCACPGPRVVQGFKARKPTPSDSLAPARSAPRAFAAANSFRWWGSVAPAPSALGGPLPRRQILFAASQAVQIPTSGSPLQGGEREGKAISASALPI